jgi:membrane protease YdiL (CAAX protease family)
MVSLIWTALSQCGATNMRSSFPLVLELVLFAVGIALIATGIFPFTILLLFILAWVSLRVRHLRWRDVGLSHPPNWWVTIGLGLLIGIGYQALDTVFIGPLLQRITGEATNLSQFAGLQGNPTALIASLILTWTEAAFIEEMVFRGYLLNRLMDLFGTERAGIILALFVHAALFGLGHTYQDLTGVLDTALAGFLIGLLYLRFRRNLWLPILIHGVIDTTGFLLIYFGLASS